MGNIKKLIKDTIELFPENIDIFDGELRGDNGFYSEELKKEYQKVIEAAE